MLLRCFITLKVLRKDHDALARAGQTEQEDEGEFSEIISQVARQLHQVFTREKLVNYYVHVQKTAVREMVTHQFGKLPLVAQRNLSGV